MKKYHSFTNEHNLTKYSWRNHTKSSWTDATIWWLCRTYWKKCRRQRIPNNWWFFRRRRVYWDKNHDKFYHGRAGYIMGNGGKGRKSATKPKDAFLYVLCVLKHYTTWEKHAFDFHMKTVLFEKIVLKIIGIVEPVFYGILTQRLPWQTRRTKSQAWKLSVRIICYWCFSQLTGRLAVLLM